MFKTTAAAMLTASALLLAPAANADTVLSVGGTGDGSTTTKPTNLNWLNHLGPATQVGYPANLLKLGSSVAAGADNLAAAVDAATGPVTIVGGSQGALVLEEYKKRLDADPNARTDINFVEYADPASKFGLFGRNPGFNILGYRTTGPVQTKYTTTVISRQYDGAADWPSNQLNLLADANAIFGFLYIHPHYGTIDTTGMTPQEVDGNTTYYRIPTENLPLLQPLRDAGVDERLVDALQGPLKAFIDSAYQQPRARASAPNMVHPQAVTGSHPTSKHKRASCAKMAVCA